MHISSTWPHLFELLLGSQVSGPIPSAAVVRWWGVAVATHHLLQSARCKYQTEDTIQLQPGGSTAEACRGVRPGDYQACCLDPPGLPVALLSPWSRLRSSSQIVYWSILLCFAGTKCAVQVLTRWKGCQHF
jgi:hypothetical protein